MFDYDSIASSESSTTISKPIYLLKTEKSLETSQTYGGKRSTLLRILPEKGSFKLCVKDETGTFYHGEPVFGVVRHTDFNKSAGYHLNEGDTLKLGKTFLSVKQINCRTASENTNPAEDNLNDLNPTRVISVKGVKKKKRFVPSCKICLLEENEEENPLINPCTCSGSMKYIHIDCLKSWYCCKKA